MRGSSRTTVLSQPLRGALAAACLTAFAALAAEGAPGATALADSAAVRYTAAPGELNSVVMVVEGSEVRITDTGATIAVGAGCVSLGPTEVRCSNATDQDGIFDIWVRTDDGNDSILASSVAGAWASFDWEGGAGDDHLRLCVPQDDWPNFLSGDGGNDKLEICPELPSSGYYPPSLHYMRGGPGNDILIGGREVDLLSGEQGSDTLYGKQHGDVLRGGSGPDHLKGGAGRDTLRGGPGRDRLSACDGRADRVFGGPDRDVARIDWRRDVVRAVEAFL